MPGYPGVNIPVSGTNIELRDLPIPKSDDDDYYDTVPDADFITSEEGVQMAQAIEAQYFIECSAITQHNVFYLFYEAARLGRLHSIQAARAHRVSITNSSLVNGLIRINCCFSFRRGKDGFHSWLCQRQGKA